MFRSHPSQARAWIFRTRIPLFALAIALSSCGYRFTANGGTLPKGIRSVQVPVMLNVTGEPNAEVFFTQALREQALKAGTLDNANAQARIEGTLVQVMSTPMSVAAGSGVTIRLTAVAQLKLIQNGVLITQTMVTGDEDVLPPATGSKEQIIAATEASRGAALRRLADVLMREGYERLCASWN